VGTPAPIAKKGRIELSGRETMRGDSPIEHRRPRASDGRDVVGVLAHHGNTIRR